MLTESLTQLRGLAELSLRNAFTSCDELQARAAYYTERSGACPYGTGADRGTRTPNILITSEAHYHCAIPAYVLREEALSQLTAHCSLFLGVVFAYHPRS